MMEPTIYFSMFPADVEFEHCQEEVQRKKRENVRKEEHKNGTKVKSQPF